MISYHGGIIKFLLTCENRVLLDEEILLRVVYKKGAFAHTKQRVKKSKMKSPI